MGSKIKGFRVEKDSIGKINVPKNAYFGAQTQRAVENFKIGWPFDFSLILPYVIIKKCAAKTNFSQKIYQKKFLMQLYMPATIYCQILINILNNFLFLFSRQVAALKPT